MKHRTTSTIALALSAACILLAGAAQPAATPSAELADPLTPAKPAPVWQPFEAKLQALSPDNPLGYYLLAEEVADVGDDPERLALARRLYAMAYDLDRTRGSGQLAASAALGLAHLAHLERDRQWLSALAGAMDRRYLLPDWSVAAWPTVSEDVAYKAATAIGAARSGDGREARRLLAEPGVTEVLTRYERALGATGGSGALQRIQRYADQWPCRECGNARAVTRPGPRGPETVLCPTCQGSPGPRLSEDEFIAYLRFESALLSGIHRSWGAQVMVDGGSPLRDPDPEELAATFEADIARPYFRDGAWSDQPATP